MKVGEAIEVMKHDPKRLATPVPVGDMAPMTFVCSFSAEGASPAEVAAIWPGCPDDLGQFWEQSRSARLFEDERYGQWGLEVLDPVEAAKATSYLRSTRGPDFANGDLVVGRFLGDSDLLLVRCDRAAHDFGSVLVVPPLDPRQDWYKAGETFAAFLEKYVKSGGDKFWAWPQCHA